MNNLQQITEEYMKLLSVQTFNQKELDYSIFKRHIPVLDHLALIGNSGISIFDHFRKEPVFYSLHFFSY